MFVPDCTHKMLILLNFAQKSLLFHWHSEEYSPVVQGAAEPGQVGPPAPPHLPPAGQDRPPGDPGSSRRKRNQFLPSPPEASVPARGAGVQQGTCSQKHV